MSRIESVNPEVLRWARETAGLDLEEAARQLGLADSASSSSRDKLKEIEAGDRYPTQLQLVKFAHVYRRPLVALYLDTPPKPSERGEDFRSTEESSSVRENALLDALLRDIQARQEMVKDLLVDEEDASPLPFVGSASVDDGVATLVASIASVLHFDPMSLRERRGSKVDLFRRLRKRAERVGVFVILAGDLGSWHTDIPSTVFRGYAIADPVTPFVVINDNDAEAARSFTLIHELAHIWLGASGVSGAPKSGAVDTPKRILERFCNDVASEFLLPPAALSRHRDVLMAADLQAAKGVIADLAETWLVSHSMAAYRCYRIGAISAATYERLAEEFRQRWEFARNARREESRGEDPPAISAHVISRSRLGQPLLSVVRRNLQENVITYTEAAKILGTKPTSVEALLDSSRAASLRAGSRGRG